MANPPPPTPDGIADDFFEQIFSMPPYGGSMAGGEAGMALQLGSGEGSAGMGGGGGFPPGAMFPLGLSLEQGKGGFSKAEEGSGSGKRPREEAEGTAPNKADRDPIQLGSLFPTFGHQFRPNPPPQVFHGQGTHGGASAAPQPPAPRPRVRARRGQATDPHSIAERLRRERIAERLRALQELVPNTNKTDRAAMLDEILDYVKFLKLQVRVLSMSRLGGTGAVAQLVADIPLSSHEGETRDGGSEQQVWEKWSTDGTERQVAKLMDEDVGAAMQFLQTKALCMMPISLATAIYDTHNQSDPPAIKPEPNTPS